MKRAGTFVWQALLQSTWSYAPKFSRVHSPKCRNNEIPISHIPPRKHSHQEIYSHNCKCKLLTRSNWPRNQLRTYCEGTESKCKSFHTKNKKVGGERVPLSWKRLIKTIGMVWRPLEDALASATSFFLVIYFFLPKLLRSNVMLSWKSWIIFARPLVRKLKTPSPNCMCPLTLLDIRPKIWAPYWVFPLPKTWVVI